MLQELRAKSRQRDREWKSSQIPDEARLLFRMTELAGEVGELANCIKKLERKKAGMVGSRTSIEEIEDEIADVVISADLLAKELDIDLEEAVRRKFNKTSDKYGFNIKL